MIETKVYKNQKAFDKDVENGNFSVGCNVKFEFNLKFAGNIDVWDIDAKDIVARNIDAWNIDANNIEANNIKAWDIKANNIYTDNIDAKDIKAGVIVAINIKANNIKARKIIAGNIEANNIDAKDIKFYAFCIAYFSFKCVSVIGGRKNANSDVNSSVVLCLDNEIEFKTDKNNELIEIGGKKYEITDDLKKALKELKEIK